MSTQDSSGNAAAILAQLDPINTAAKVAAYLGKSTATLSQMRYMGTGPRFVRVGRSIRYRALDVEEYLTANTHDRTTESP